MYTQHTTRIKTRLNTQLPIDVDGYITETRGGARRDPLLYRRGLSVRARSPPIYGDRVCV